MNFPLYILTPHIKISSEHIIHSAYYFYCLLFLITPSITLLTKVRLVKAMVFPVVMYGCVHLDL